MHKNTLVLVLTVMHVCVYQLEKHGSLSHGNVSNMLVLTSLCDGKLYSLGTFICIGTTIQKFDRNWLNRYLYSYDACNLMDTYTPEYTVYIP